MSQQLKTTRRHAQSSDRSYKTADLRDVFPYLPIGHGSGLKEPATQYDPRGQSVGVLEASGQ